MINTRAEGGWAVEERGAAPAGVGPRYGLQVQGDQSRPESMK